MHVLYVQFVLVSFSSVSLATRVLLAVGCRYTVLVYLHAPRWPEAQESIGPIIVTFLLIGLGDWPDTLLAACLLGPCNNNNNINNISHKKYTPVQLLCCIEVKPFLIWSLTPLYSKNPTTNCCMIYNDGPKLSIKEFTSWLEDAAPQQANGHMCSNPNVHDEDGVCGYGHFQAQN